VLTGWLFSSRSKKLRIKLEEQNIQNKQFVALEQQALQAQMNPHFIFNCLNSIQQYILTNNKEKANEYLTGFAALIRQTLDNSNKKTITIAEEIQYLTRYLSYRGIGQL
jgi:LytS/YehU family sensor histidine kinase